MKVSIQSVADRGNAEKERLVLKARADLDIGDYVFLQTGYHDGDVTVGAYHTYWFPYKKINAGDLVVLYSKDGKENTKNLRNGNRAHFFYLAAGRAIWKSRDRAPVVLFAPEWVSKSPEEL